MMIKDSEKPNHKRIPDFIALTLFQGKANLHRGNVAECYYNTQSKETCNDPQYTQTLYGEENLLHKRINDYAQIISIDYQD